MKCCSATGPDGQFFTRDDLVDSVMDPWWPSKTPSAIQGQSGIAF